MPSSPTPRPRSPEADPGEADPRAAARRPRRRLLSTTLDGRHHADRAGDHEQRHDAGEERHDLGATGWFVRAVRGAQSSDASFSTITPHDVRHTAASLAISAGANVKAVQRMLGHASAAMTLDVYADLFDDDLESVTMSAARAAAIS